MTARGVSTGRTRYTLLIAALGAVSSVFGYSIAHFVFFETLVQIFAGPAGSPGYVEVRDAMVTIEPCCGGPLSVVMAFVASLYLEERLKNRISSLFRIILIVVTGITIGLIVYIPFMVFFTFAWAI